MEETMPQNVLITGANRGLGLELTRVLLQSGHRIFAINRRESEALLQLREEFPDDLLLYKADVTDEFAIADILRRIAEEFGHLDLVINNAAVHLDHAKPDLEQVDFSVYLPTFSVNAVAPLIVVKHALPLLRRGGGKLIVNVSSEAGGIGTAWRKNEYSYCMSKAALNMASRLLQNAYKEEGIKVLALHPGWFNSDMGGSQAPITTRQAAQDVAKLLTKTWSLEGPVYVDPQGEALAW
jgi:NAD(P)-dependent dehydrogenase (short-subunit alcohol dehydrogenase family)